MAIINGTALGETINGTADDDIINGLEGADRLFGLEGNDILIGGAGTDLINGGTGIDTASYADAAAAVVVSLALAVQQNTIGAGNDTLVEIENLTGSAFNDKLSGNAGDNVIDGLLGVDTVSYAAAAAGVTVDLGIATAQNTGGDGIDTLLNIESLIGSAFNDVLAGTSGNNVLNGGGGNDWVSYANAVAAVAVNLALTGQQDTLGAGRDTITNIENILGSAFDDRLRGSAGDNIIDGGDGLDQVSYVNASAGVVVNLGLATAQNTIGHGIDTLLNIEQLAGSAFDDVIEGSAVGNVLSGGAGIDRLSYANALAGVIANLDITTAQTVSVGKIDTLSGFEDLTGSSFNDRLGGTAGDNRLDGGAGIDTALYATATSGVTVSLAIAGPQNTIGAGVDTLSNFENLTGSGFDDVLGGNAANNVISGGAGRDFADYGAATAGVSVDLRLTIAQDTLGAGIDTLFGIENLIGSGLADTLTGNDVDNILNGGNGDDTLTGGLGNDQINGGSGSDTAVFSGLRADYSVVPTSGTLVTVTDLRAVGGDGADNLIDVEFLRFSDVTIAAQALVFISPASFSVNESTTLVGSVIASNPAPAVPGPVYAITGGADAARFAINNATGALSFLTAPDFEAPTDAGGDNIYNVIVSATDGVTAQQAITVTVLDVVEAAQQFTGSLAADVFTAPNNGPWIISGLGGIDTLTGGSNVDVIIGGKGNDILAGGDGNDIFQYATGDGLDRVDGGAGTDSIIATKANAAIGLAAISGIEVIDANGFAGVRIVGGTAADTLDFSATTLTGIGSISGLGGADTLLGSAGNDRIIGGGGRDVLTGNAGADTFAYALGTESGFGALKADVILDFAIGLDKIDLTAIDANAGIAGNQDFTFIGSDPFTALGQLRIGTDSNGDVALFGNISGNTNADFQISFDNNAAITVTDILL